MNENAPLGGLARQLVLIGQLDEKLLSKRSGRLCGIRFRW